MTDNDAILGVFLIAGVCAIMAILMTTILKLRGPKKDPEVTQALHALEQRFARVEVALDDVTSELHRVSDSHGFLTRLLSERTREPGTVDRH